MREQASEDRKKLGAQTYYHLLGAETSTTTTI